MHIDNKPSVFCKNVVENAFSEKIFLFERKKRTKSKMGTADMENIKQQPIFAYILEY